MFTVAVPAASSILMLFVSVILEGRHARMVPPITGPGGGRGVADIRMRPWSGGIGLWSRPTTVGNDMDDLKWAISRSLCAVALVLQA